MEKVQLVVDFLLTHKILFSALILLFIIVLRRLILSRIRGDDAFITEEQRSWMSRTKNGTFALTLILLFILWQSEISEFALSVTAIAVAIVVASKEIILCFTGSIQRASSRSFRIGDWIEVCTGQVQQDTFFREFSNSIGDRSWFAECSLSKL